MMRADGAADWWCYSYRVLLKGLPTTMPSIYADAPLVTRNMPTYALAARVVVRECGVREASWGRRCCSTTMIERTKIPDTAAQHQGLLCRVWTFVSLVKFHQGSPPTTNLSACNRPLRIPPKPIGSQACLNDRFTLCEIDELFTCASTTSEHSVLLAAGKLWGEAIKEARHGGIISELVHLCYSYAARFARCTPEMC